MNQSFRFHGIIPPVVTLFDQQGEIDESLNRQYLDRIIDAGVHGILLLGSSGEFTSLTLNERKQFAEAMIKHIDGRVPVLIGAGGTALKEVLELVAHAEESGADGVLVVNPYYWKLSEEQLFHYYSTIAEHTALPVLLYNIPLLTGQSIPLDIIIHLAKEHPNICGIKETVAEISHIREIIFALKKIRPDFMVFSAYDEHMFSAVAIGAAGSINGSAGFAPEISVGLYRALQQENYREAISYHNQLSVIMELYSYGPSFFTTLKEAVHQRWFSEPAGHRAPFDVFSQDLSQKVKSLLSRLEKIDRGSPA
ncbi:MAG: dihydrodipicolinate synthase family protein [Bacillaceae bacterium]|nr:dihydrodipicolinate synthase family protein [Bacillaceae bacterium]